MKKIGDQNNTIINRKGEHPGENAHQHDDDYTGFQDFGAEEWRQWIIAYVIGDPRPPLLPLTNEESHHVLIRVFDNLDEKQSCLFRRVLFSVFESTPVLPKNERLLYDLLHTIAYSVPIEAKWLLRRRLREGIFRRLNYGRQNLHSLLLLVCSKYDVDDELADYVKRSARASKDYSYLLLCQWVLSARGGPEAFCFIERLLPLMISEIEAGELCRQLTSIGRRLGYNYFLEWYRSKSVELEVAWPEQWQVFVTGLKNRLLSDDALPALAAQDQDSVSLYAELRTAEDEIPLETVLTLARLHAGIGVVDASNILYDVWKTIYERSGEVPWDYLTAREKHGVPRFTAGTICRVRQDRYQEVQVPTEIEPTTEKALIEARNLYEPLITERIARIA